MLRTFLPSTVIKSAIVSFIRTNQRRYSSTYLHNNVAYHPEDKFAWEIADESLGMKTLNGATALRSSSLHHANLSKYSKYNPQNLSFTSKFNVQSSDDPRSVNNQIKLLTKDREATLPKQEIHWYNPLQDLHVEGFIKLTDATPAGLAARRQAVANPFMVNPPC